MAPSWIPLNSDGSCCLRFLSTWKTTSYQTVVRYIFTETPPPPLHSPSPMSPCRDVSSVHMVVEARLAQISPKPGSLSFVELSTYDSLHGSSEREHLSLCKSPLENIVLPWAKPDGPMRQLSSTFASTSGGDSLWGVHILQNTMGGRCKSLTYGCRNQAGSTSCQWWSC